ncbi:sensor domain-containing diguanylate cyclase [Paenibacillus oralis]|uniref:Sensor domain-containing diguanylate cyclase n=1 Tax=Paenibacillus oralis TaxID=2490856 RepID=A0A3P3UDN7_9BACL|nr:sensor domain-containing diguanylate cyclase [Paenibacillus oralis]RRJ66573.1 sensor domain-containing diguanylate cyclase [Paenibacillus oralis]
MADQSRGHPTLNMNISSMLPRPEQEGGCADWLQQLDITAYDYPYIEPVILQAYRDLCKNVSEIAEGGEVRFFVAHHDGELMISGTEEDESSEDRGDASHVAGIISRCIEVAGPAVIPQGRFVYAAAPIYTRREGEMFAVFGCRLQDAPDYEGTGAKLFIRAVALHFRTCFYKAFEALFIADMLLVQQRAKREEHRRSKLFQVVQKLHDKIDVDSVLSEVFERVSGMYPAAKLELLMSQDDLSRDPRVKLLQLQGPEEQFCVKAFMEGQMLSRKLHGPLGELLLEIAAPLGGKQGVYGVFRLLIRRDLIDEFDLQLIGMLADTAGVAFENAKLYQQSNLLINELRLINELTKRLNQSLKLKEVFRFASDELLSIFQAEYCCISQLHKETGTFEVMSTNVPGLSKRTFPEDYGFCGLVCSTQEPIILSDYQVYGKVSSQMMEVTKARSLIAAPLIVRGEVNGAIMLAHREGRYFSYDNYKLLQVLSSHIGLAIANALLHAEVRRMANRDMLTGLYARHYVDDAIQQFQKKDSNGSLIIVDIDQFKQVNDTYGHQTGDKILQQVCTIVKSSIRKTDIAARWGGEELAIYLPGADAENAYRIAETIRLRAAMDTDPAVTVSCGIAEWAQGDGKVSVESLFYEADMALYKAKNNGRNQTQLG